MILIFSISDDYSTSRVINWLKTLNKSFIRINEQTNVKLVSLTEKDFVLAVDGQIVKSDEITKVWYRRGDIDLLKHFTSKEIDHYLSTENASLMQYLRYTFDKKESINNFKTRDLNKLYLLDLCKKFKVLAPNFVVTGSKATLLDFYRKEHNIISKPLHAPLSMFGADNSFHMAYTTEITRTDIAQLPDEFVPTFFQKTIEKEYEIRGFYLEGNFYSMAIFSQQNTQTKVDFRNYDNAKPNRLTPYQLPKYYQHQLKKLFDYIGLNCASFDVIFSKKDHQYYFLDLNPIGQFGMVSTPCNYNLEKEIALSL